jgi:hypothetical protein
MDTGTLSGRSNHVSTLVQLGDGLMVTSFGGSTMPRPIPVPVRQAMFRLWQQGHGTNEIAAALGLARSTVRRLKSRFRRQGSEGISPDYRPPAVVEASSSGVEQTALRLRREHPTWGPV